MTEQTQTIGDYTIERVLDTDGMLRTYLSTRPHTSKKVVIKVMTLKNPLMIESFVNEAEKALKIHHPNIVRVLEVGKDASTESPYVVMENVEATPLDQYSRENKITSQLVRKIICDIARALVALNEQGMIHNNINPSNILICKDGSIKLTGFGIVKNTSSGQAADGTVVMDKAANGTVIMDKATEGTVVMDKATEGTVVMDKAADGTVVMDKADGTVVMDKADGTVVMDKAADGTVVMDKSEQNTMAYLSPEQVRDTETADIRSDIYSLGATLYAIVSGHAPFAGVSSSELLRKVLEAEPQPISKSSPDMDDNLVFLIEWMMEKSPRNRPQAPRELLEVLGAAMSSTSRMILGIAALAAIVIICAALFFCLGISSKDKVSRQSSPANDNGAEEVQDASSNLTSEMVDDMVDDLEDYRKHVTFEERLANVRRKLKKAGMPPKSGSREASEKIAELSKDADYVSRNFNEFKAQVLQAQLYRIEKQIRLRDFAKNLDKSKFDAEATRKLQETLISFQNKNVEDYGMFSIIKKPQNDELEKISNDILEQIKSGKVDPNVEVNLKENSTYTNDNYEKGKKPLLYSIVKGETNGLLDKLKNKREIVLELLKLGANANDFIERTTGWSSEYMTVLTNGGIDRLENRLIPLLNGIQDPSNSWRIPIVKELILLNHDVNEKDGQGNTALHYAVKNKLFDVAALLIASGADVNARNNSNETPLFDAARTVQPMVEKLLLNHGADATIQNKEGKTFDYYRDFGLFCKAALACDLKTLRNYLEKGFSPDTVLETNNNTLLEYAIAKENFEMVELLLKHKANTELHNANYSTPLTKVNFNKPLKDNKIFNILLEYGANPNVKNPYGRGFLLDGLMTYRQMDVLLNRADYKIDYIKELVVKGNASIGDKDSYSNIFVPEYKTILPRILDRIDGFDYDIPVLVFALANDAPDDVIKILIEKKANVNCVFSGKSDDFPRIYSDNFLQDKSKENTLRDGKGAERLLERIFESSNKKYSRTALYIAVERRRLGAVKLLLEHGANKDWVSNSGKQTRQLETSEEIKELLK